MPFSANKIAQCVNVFFLSFFLIFPFLQAIFAFVCLFLIFIIFVSMVSMGDLLSTYWKRALFWKCVQTRRTIQLNWLSSITRHIEMVWRLYEFRFHYIRQPFQLTYSLHKRAYCTLTNIHLSPNFEMKQSNVFHTKIK